MIVAIHEHLVTRIPRFSASHDSERTWSLHIRKAQSEDAGRYMCQVNSNPMITQVGIVDVVGITSRAVFNSLHIFHTSQHAVSHRAPVFVSLKGILFAMSVHSSIPMMWVPLVLVLSARDQFIIALSIMVYR